MEVNKRKFQKKTNIVQFQKLVELMEEYPHLATGSPIFGGSKMLVEGSWENVAKQINAFGPPVRSGLEWKRVWHDQKCRVKRKICENNRNLRGTGGGPCTINNLTALELHIDRICHLSSAAAPSGKVLGLVSAKLETTPPRRPAQIAIITPSSSNPSNVNNKQTKDSNIFTENSTSNIILEQSYITPNLTTELFQQSTPLLKQKTKIRSTSDEQKRKMYNIKSKNTSDRLKLLQEQNDIQNKTLDIMNKHAEAAKVQAEAAKIQAEAAKILTEVAQRQAETLQEIAESNKIIGQSLVDILNYLKEE